ncbi:MAG TPA: glycine betaine ABC transporter substrate-binding protein [Planctomycetaceae bacterium]|nr:glycine betaine ABC transporter substrate-binding protein [Planctomycetaceae bacterium]
MRRVWLFAGIAGWLVLAGNCAADEASSAGDAPLEAPRSAVQIGSKAFTESVVLGEILTHLARDAGAAVRHRRQLGGTQILWRALTTGEIDAYPEYSGTITAEIFAGRDLAGEDEIRAALAEHGVVMSRPLGFNNTYALGLPERLAGSLALRTISDLRRHPELKFGFSNEFLERGDGWPGLKRHYGLPQDSVRGLDHDLAYRALASGDIHLTDLYSTDAEIRYYGLRVLRDDLAYFPQYDAVLLYRRDLEHRAPRVVDALRQLEGRLTEETMIALNARAKLDRLPEARVAADYLRDEFGVDVTVHEQSLAERVGRRTAEHLFLVGVSLAAAIVLAIPLGVLSARAPRAGQAILGVTGILQTIPSLVLFVLVIPWLGLGAKPAIFALFVYSLLPIVRNTASGLADIPLPIHESARALGLSAAARLRLIELPLAARSILAGIKTAAVINVGTATLGGFIGAGGYGEPIFTGIRKDSPALLLEGAIPAALLALAVQGLFELAERRLVPRGLRLKVGQPD